MCRNEPAWRRQCGRRGTILVLVAGIAAMLLSLTVAFYLRVKGGAETARLVQADAQARIMLSAALMYLQETSRLGWGGDRAHTGIHDPAAEAFGWTDIRDGEPGPRGPTQPGGARPALYRPGAYPALGTAMRGDTFTWRRAPYAMSQQMAPNPVVIPARDASGTDLHDDRSISENYIGKPKGSKNYIRLYLPVWQAVLDGIKEEGVANYSAPPATENWDDFARGEQVARPESEGLAWFRIYREEPAEHDGIPNNADGDWYDVMPIAGHSVFVIAAGAGASRGYRFWDQSTDWLGGVRRSARWSAKIEPQTASSSGLFDEQTFAAIRGAERILWFRAEWSAWTSAGFVPTESLEANISGHGGLVTALLTRNAKAPWKNAYPFAGGTFSFIQRLEREPPRW